MLSDYSQAVASTSKYQRLFYLLAGLDLAILLLAVFVPLPAVLVAIVAIALFASVGFLRSGYLYLLTAVAGFEGFVRFGAHYYVAHYTVEFVLALAVCAGIFFRAERFTFPPEKILRPFLVFAAWVVFRTVFAVNLLVASKALVMFLAAVVVYLLAYHLINSLKVLEKALVFQIVTSLAFVALILSGQLPESGTRLHFLESSPNAIGIYVYGTTTIAALSFTILKNRTLKLLALLQFLGLSYVLLLANSRASLLALAVFCTVFLWLRGYRKLVWAGLAIVAASIVLILQFNMMRGFVDYLYIAFRMGQGVTMREQIWISGMKLIADYPIAGVGPRCVGEVFSNYVSLTNPRMMFAAHNAVMSGMLHNGVLNLTAQYGLVGLALVSWVIASSAKFLVAARKRLSGRESSVLWAFIVAFLLSYFSHGVFENSLPYGIFVLYFYPAIFVAGAFRLIARQT